ncbi:flagellar biosynthesis protein FlhA [Fodinibius sediminis]|uniref:Flagellar biosynthesis protein FlhA n=1 Tax=Fodinibius sediminis TaxID=1214077 RepID=A0A521CHX7_9BACT|nr:flagellar biosynthesis protein FlhA [Fodinibius sediminis]SMO58965.1 flagellar biosynthesis protein FlhA [Fodinibius sediminis]
MAEPDSNKLTSLLTQRTDILVASSIIAILMVMILPIPPMVLDFFLAMNVSLSVIVLLVAFYTLKPLEFAVFPGMLLILTLFRLSLNVASTRLILSEGYAGNLIEAFGSYVVQGNYVIGIIIFSVLIIINFIVITKGAGRVAEVSARFTLDAMPGKQMAIDADLSSGLITDEEARRRREEISRESDFYGAMDGASKFVRGDVIAGLLITFINIVGGLVIGTMQQGLSIADAAAKFTLLTVGDGLVSQIPALLISTASGIIVTRAASEGNLSSEITAQLFGSPKVITMGGGFVLLMGILPGMPLIPFWLIAGILFYYAYKKNQKQAVEELEVEELETDQPPEEKVEDYLLMDTLELEIGYSLIPLVDPDQGGDLLDRMASLRKQLAIELGILVPPIRIRDNIQLDSNDYVIKMRGIEQGRGDLLPEYHLALLPADFDIKLSGVKTTDPTFGMDAVWVSERNKYQAEKYGLSVIEAGAVITTHFMEIIKRNAHKLLDRQMVQRLVDNLKETSPAVVEELVPEKMNLGGVQKVLRRLLKEQVPIRDLNTILETLADYYTQTQNPDVLTEYVRSALKETITEQYQDSGGEVTVCVLDSPLESHLIERAQQGQLNPNTLGFTADTVEKLYVKSSKAFEEMIGRGQDPVLLTSPVLRPALYDFLVSVIPEITVLSYNDLTIDTQINKAGTISLQKIEPESTPVN